MRQNVDPGDTLSTSRPSGPSRTGYTRLPGITVFPVPRERVRQNVRASRPSRTSRPDAANTARAAARNPRHMPLGLILPSRERHVMRRPLTWGKLAVIFNRCVLARHLRP